jgi:hypothetical protein
MLYQFKPSWKPDSKSNWIELIDCCFLVDKDNYKWYCLFELDDGIVDCVIPTNRVLPELKFTIKPGIIRELYYSESPNKYKMVMDDLFYNIVMEN